MNFVLLKKLSEAAGVPGQEDNLRAIVRAELTDLVDKIEVDRMGNVIGRKKGASKRRVMIAAHMDEIGFIVKFIDAKGFVRLQPLGGFDPRQLFAQRVIVHCSNGQGLRGVLSYTTKPTHLLGPDEGKEAPKLDNFFVDLGMTGTEAKRLVSMGDMVTMDRTCETCGDNIIGKCLDNRVGLFVMIEAMRKLGRHKAEIFAVATVQEEVGLRGATTAAFHVDPDIGIALDTTLANDFPGQTEQDAITHLGKGVGIKIMDGSLICHRPLVDHFRKVAQKHKIAHQMEILPRGGTDAGALQRSRGGVASITLSVPTRYIHTVNEMISKWDVESAIDLLAHYLVEAHTQDYAYE